MRMTLIGAVLLVSAAAGIATAAQMQMPHQPDAAPGNEVAAAFAAANEKMHQAMMAQPLTGNVDQDFVAGMIPHHQGAIDMARILLKYSKDPGLRKLATNIVAAQQKEIAVMREWQARHKP